MSQRWHALDGLRGVAVLLVLVEHLYGPAQGTGALGVGIFFVLSGFLITSVILRDREAGTWSFRTFITGRAVRLGPAMLAMVASFSALWLASGRSASALAGHAAQALLYVEDFTRADGGNTVFGHTWSLAVEEQFYLLWPLALPFVLRLNARARLATLGVTIGLSIAVRLAAAQADLTDLAYAGLPTNLYAMLLGCVVALTRPKLTTRAWAPTLTAGLAFAFAAGVVLGARSIITPVLGALVAAALIPALTSNGWCYSAAPLRYAGRISYALYLWHWPALWLTGTALDPGEGMLVVLGATAAAIASTHLLEEPIRRRWKADRRPASRIVELPATPAAVTLCRDAAGP
jgi:peptidoglycan/LPS O-acetylase OafA/YrhL